METIVSDEKQAAQVDAEPQTPPPESDSADAQQPSEPDDSDTFSRSYVERLRRESAGYRTERDQLSELLAVAHRERIDTEIRSLGVKPDAVWSTVSDPIELLNADGQPDSKKIRDAVTAAREKLGIKPNKAQTGLRSGSSTGPQLPRTEKFVDAFKPARDR